MFDKLIQIDQLTINDHSYIESTDSCIYFGEYTAREGFAFSNSNQLIFNLKKCVSRRGTAEYQYKNSAITTVSNDLSRCLNSDSLENVTFIPIPPSKAKTDPLYDNRLTLILEALVRQEPNADCKEFVVQTETTRSSHGSDNRLSIEELVALYEVDETLTSSVRDTIIIFDDMLTTGTHFKAMQQVIENRFPDKKIIGLFICRRAANTINPFEDII
jgi:predicted amidophosphoribosyltransferase